MTPPDVDLRDSPQCSHNHSILTHLCIARAIHIHTVSAESQCEIQTVTAYYVPTRMNCITFYMSIFTIEHLQRTGCSLCSRTFYWVFCNINEIRFDWPHIYLISSDSPHYLKTPQTNSISPNATSASSKSTPMASVCVNSGYVHRIIEHVGRYLEYKFVLPFNYSNRRNYNLARGRNITFCATSTAAGKTMTSKHFASERPR